MKKFLNICCVCVCLLFLNFTHVFANNNPLASVVIPAYNVEKYIEECLNSIINQTYKNLEIIIIDDGSKDKTRDIIQKFQKQDGRIKFIKSEKNLGVSATRNKGIDNTNGKYLYFIDSDDFIDLDFIEHFVKSAEKYNADIVVTNNIVYSYGSEDVFKPVIELNSNSFNIPYKRKSLQYRQSVIWNKIFRAQFVKDNKIYFSLDLQYAEDELFNAYTFAIAKNIIGINPNSWYYYRVNPHSICNSRTEYQKILTRLKVFTMENEYYITNNFTDKMPLYTNLLKAALFYSDGLKLKKMVYNDVYNTVLKTQDTILNNQDLYTKHDLMLIKAIIKNKTFFGFLLSYILGLIKLYSVIVTILIVAIASFTIITLVCIYRIIRDFLKNWNIKNENKNGDSYGI